MIGATTSVITDDDRERRDQDEIPDPEQQGRAVEVPQFPAEVPKVALVPARSLAEHGAGRLGHLGLDDRFVARDDLAA